MATPPVPNSGTGLSVNKSAAEAPVPLPQTKVPACNEKVSASDIFRSIGTVSKQIEDVVTTENNAYGTFVKTLTTSRAIRDSVTKKVIEGTKTAGLKLLRPKKPDVPVASESAEPAEVKKENTMYDNWTLPKLPSSQKEGNVRDTASRPSLSTISGFDPLNATSSSPKYEGMSNEQLMLESFLAADTYVTIVSKDHHEDIFEDYGETDYCNPLTPPERFDSLLPEEAKPPLASISKVKENYSNWYEEDDNEKNNNVDEDTKQHQSMISLFSRNLKLDSVLNRPVKLKPPKIEVVKMPPVNTKPVYHSGILKISEWLADGLIKNNQSCFCVLSERKLMCYSDPTNGVLKEAYPLNDVYSLQIVLPQPSSTYYTYCLELTLSSGSGQAVPRKVVFTCANGTERRNWAQNIAEHLAHRFTPMCTAGFNRVGWCYLKEEVTGEWRCAWLILIRRVLVYYTAKDPKVYSVDLGKTRCVTTQTADEQTESPSDGSHCLLIDNPHLTLYLKFTHGEVLKDWRYMLKLAAHNDGEHIYSQLTKADIPVIIEKCLSYIYVNGNVSEGIYRRGSSTCPVYLLFGSFRCDATAAAVHLNAATQSEHDVACALRRFLQELPITLIPRPQCLELLSALEMEDSDDRHREYKRVLNSLSLEARNTAQKLVAHLNFLFNMAESDKVYARNWASDWSPTLMPAAPVRMPNPPIMLSLEENDPPGF